MYMAGHLGIGDEAKMDNERDCNNCVYSTRDGNCRKFTCEGTKTIEQIRADVIDEIIEKFSIPSNSGLEREIHLDVRELKQLKEKKNG